MVTHESLKRNRYGHSAHRPSPGDVTRANATRTDQAAVRNILRGTGLQAKLTLGGVNDVCEQEADRVAETVMRMPEPLPHHSTNSDHAAGAEETGGRRTGNGLDAEVGLEVLQGSGRPLSESERTFFEPRFGTGLSGVRIHTGPSAEAAAAALNARAFTVGQDIVFGAGHYSSGTDQGKRLLAHELTHVIQQAEGGERIQRVVDFTTNFTGISVTPRPGVVISATDYEHDYVEFTANAEIAAVGDTPAELDEWDVGILQDMIVNWEREYWVRDNADGLGRFVEQKFRPINTRFRDQEDGAATVWSADSEHALLSDHAKVPRNGRPAVSTVITTSDVPNGGNTVNGANVNGMNASDGTRNINIERTGTRFDTYISAHNVVTDEWRHLRRLNWNYQKSTDFSGSGAGLAVSAENTLVGWHGPYGAGADAPLVTGTTANDAVNDNDNYTRRRVDGWT